MTFENILVKSQKELKRALKKELQELRYSPISSKGFLYAKGTVPVLLVAHLDTVHREGVKIICYSKGGKILMSPQGIGGDDRAGVYMILQLLKSHRCHVLFCEDEECGGVGAHNFAESNIKPAVNYIIEFDRRGSNDAVFYDCANEEFTQFVCGFGFEESIGSFSDISIVAPALGVAAVNLSAGYYNEHTAHEYINMLDIHNNLDRARRMIATRTGKFEYVEAYGWRGWFLDGYDDFTSLLMPLREGDYIVDEDGRMHEAGDDVLIDRRGVPHLLDPNYGCATPLIGAQAYTKESMPVRFKEELADVYEVII